MPSPPTHVSMIKAMHLCKVVIMSEPTPNPVSLPLRISAHDYAYELKFLLSPSRVRVHPPLHVCAWFVTRHTLSYGVSCYSSHTQVCLNSPLKLYPTSRDHTTLCVNCSEACPISQTHTCINTSRGADLLCTPSVPCHTWTCHTWT